MSIVFNEAAFHRLTQDPDGDFGETLQRVSETILANYRSAIGLVWQDQSAEALPVPDFEIGIGEEGLQSVIGLPSGQGHVAEYMANKFQNLEPDRFKPMIMSAWDIDL